jgi:hypothetical protein
MVERPRASGARSARVSPSKSCRISELRMPRSFSSNYRHKKVYHICLPTQLKVEELVKIGGGSLHKFQMEHTERAFAVPRCLIVQPTQEAKHA